MYKEFIINEKEGNPNILIVAGIHGDEIGTILLAYELIHKIESNPNHYVNINKLRILPVANIEGMRTKSRNKVRSSNDMNRAWDYKRYEVEDIINELLDDSDIVIDLHCSENCDSMFLLDKEMEKLDNIIYVLDKNNVHYCIQSTKNDTLKRIADSKGKIGLTWEQKGLNYADISTNNKSLDILSNLLDELHLMTKSPMYTKNNELSYYLSNNYEGIYIPVTEVGQVVQEGEVVGKIIDLETNSDLEYLVAKKVSRVIDQSNIMYIQHWKQVILLQPLDAG